MKIKDLLNSEDTKARKNNTNNGFRFNNRTDLIIEHKAVLNAYHNNNLECDKESLETSKKSENEANSKGIDVISYEKDNYLFTNVKITNKKASEELNKPIGSYITIESQDLKENNTDSHEKIIHALSEELKSLCHLKPDDSILITGLGNWNITPDALGPKVVSKILVTRHLENATPLNLSGNLRSVSAISPGVMGITGIETGEIIKGLVDNLKPSLIIAIDALAARKSSRINATIQMSDTGIAPGAGVGNPRMILNEETLGIPVVAIGVPTVVDAATLVNDTMDCILESMIQQTDKGSEFYNMLYELNQEDKYSLISKLLDPYTENMFVTPKEVDAVIDRLSGIIADSINIALHSGITLEDIGKYA